MQQPVPHADQCRCTREERQKNACEQVADLRSDQRRLIRQRD